MQEDVTRSQDCNPWTEIILPIVPPTVTAQQKGVFVRNGRAHFFTKASVRRAENFLAALLAKYQPKQPLDGPVSLHVEWTFPFRKSERKAITNARQPIPHTSRPDVDNLAKGLLDTMTHLRFWLDDSLICDEHFTKFWGPLPRIRIRYRRFIFSPSD